MLWCVLLEEEPLHKVQGKANGTFKEVLFSYRNSILHKYGHCHLNASALEKSLKDGIQKLFLHILGLVATISVVHN